MFAVSIMSLVPNVSYVIPGDPSFIPYGANDAYMNYLNSTQISTGNILLDGVSLDGSFANGGQLLINGVAVATVNQNVSSITNWASYPALSTISYGAGGGALNMSNITTSNLTVSSINGIATQGSVYVDGNTYFNGNITVATSSNVVLCSTATSYTFLSNHAYAINCPTTITPVSYTGTGYMTLGVEPLATITSGGNLNVNRGSVSQYMNGLTYSQGTSFINLLNGNYYALSNVTTPLAVWCYVFPGGVTNAVLAANINLGSSDVVYIQDLGVQVQH